MSKLNLCVIFGGVSSEHEVSLISAASVLQHIDQEKYTIHMIYIDKNGGWFYYDGAISDVANETDWAGLGLDRAFLSPDRSDHGILRFTDTGVVRIPIDVVFPVLHGKNGEDGTIQGLFEIAGIPYVGAGVLGSALCMDKCIAKTLFAQAGIPQADWIELKRGQTPDFEKIEAQLGYPCFVKPANAGSSVGITKAKNREELRRGIEVAFAEDEKLLIEEAVSAREVESSVIGNLHPRCAEALGEIAPAAEFYDYDAKYNDENSKLTIPANLDAKTQDAIRAYALQAYQLCECRGMARVDFFVDKETGEIKLNELNTLPGFTSISMYPKLWAASGLAYPALIDELIRYAIGRAQGGTEE